MKQRFASQLLLLAILGVGLLVLTNTWARQNSAFDQLDLLIDVRHELMSNYVEQPDGQAMVQGAVEGMVETLNDPYTTYLTPEDLEMFEHQVGGSFTGIGAEVDVHQNRVRIVTPLEDSPAWKAGVLAGDLILEIEGESTLDMPLTQAVRLLTGEAGTDVTIRLRHEDGTEEQITITRGVIDIQTVRGFRRQADQAYDMTLDPEQRIGYVRLTQFTQRTPQEMAEALTALMQRDQPIEALVLDVRFNAGGLLSAAHAVSDMFLEPGQTIVTVEGRSVPREVYESTDRTIVPDIPIVVLANEASASGAEILAGALKDNNRALVVGTRTFGKGSVQQVKQLERGRGALRMTNAYYYIPSGRLIHRREDSETWGVDPSDGSYVLMSADQIRRMLEARREHERVRRDNGDVELPRVTPEWIENTLHDPQLAAALRAAQGRLETGEWPEVGKSNGEQLALAQRENDLRQRREALMEQLNEVDRQLAQFVADGEGGNGDEADDAQDAQDAPQQEEAQEQPQPQNDEADDAAREGGDEAEGDADVDAEAEPDQEPALTP